MTATNYAIVNAVNPASIEKRIQKSQGMRSFSLHEGNINSETILRICKMMIIPMASYFICFVPSSDPLRRKWRTLEQEILKSVQSVLTLTKNARMRTIAGMETLEQIETIPIGHRVSYITAKAEMLHDSR